jgi:hypothetical protein
MKMKIKSFKIAAFLFIITAFSACMEEQVKPDDKKSSTETERVVLLKTELDHATFNLFGSKFKTNVSGRAQTGIHRFSGLFRSKAEAARRAEDWDTCALITITENTDGTYTVILNFGEGCEDNGKFITGVVAFTGSETDTSGVFKIAFDKFSERGVNEVVENPATINGFYEGSWSISLNNGLEYEEAFQTAFEVNYLDGAKETIAAEGELVGDLDGFVVNKYNFAGSNLNNDVYAAFVVNPLVFDFDCKNTTIFTAGTEAFKCNDESAAIDFGEGACDNIFTILLEGITIIIDLDKIDA